MLVFIPPLARSRPEQLGELVSTEDKSKIPNSNMG